VDLKGSDVLDTNSSGSPSADSGARPVGSAVRAAVLGSLSGDPHDVVNPATEQVIASVGQASIEDADAAITRASRAFASWRAVAPADRGRLLRRFADLVDGAGEELAQLEVTNSGHPIGNARWEAGNVRDVLNYYSAAPERLNGKQIPVAGGVDITFSEPLGVVGIIVPWNFPMPIAGWGFAPALAAGNTVVLKPAELTPLTAIRLGELALEAGIPEGVFTVLPGKGSIVGERFVTHPDVRKVCFTGSTAVGQRIMRGAAEQVKRITLELGGKSANIIFADSDLDKAARTAPYGVFDNAGQDCCARSRILVEASVYDRFLELLEPAVRGVKVVSPERDDAEMGPLISAGQRETVSSYVEGDSVDVAFRGTAPDGPGYWYPPTVLLPRSTADRVWREEVFGPVVSVFPFTDEADAISKANDTEYGLSGSIWTRDLGRALRVSRGVDAGNLSVNSHSSVRYSTPFGGFKQSGIGRELGPDALAAFTETKNVFYAND
jgi:acyl-CoA reductase-like NAD-dependent aldehyde dehydrogenase